MEISFRTKSSESYISFVQRYSAHVPICPAFCCLCSAFVDRKQILAMTNQFAHKSPCSFEESTSPWWSSCSSPDTTSSSWIRCARMAPLLWHQKGFNWHGVVELQFSYHIPLLKLTGSKIVFYCHFPDLLMAGRSVSCLSKNDLSSFAGIRAHALPSNRVILNRRAYLCLGLAMCAPGMKTLDVKRSCLAPIHTMMFWRWPETAWWTHQPRAYQVHLPHTVWLYRGGYNSHVRWNHGQQQVHFQPVPQSGTPASTNSRVLPHAMHVSAYSVFVSTLWVFVNVHVFI